MVIGNNSAMTIGKVYLVGAGPGDPGLLTLKGQRCLAEADLVLYDGLVNPSILRHTRAVAERTSRMQGPDGKRLNQEEINRQLVEAGLAGKTVVRLKGGDPYIFGRGTEEAEALRAAGVPFEVVPGVTAATAAGEYAGISVTHRRLASAVAFITGHEDPTKPGVLDYAAIAKFPGTLVFYMGLARLPAITESLLQHGLNADTPACVVSRASRARQRTVVSTVAEIATKVKEAELPAPSLIIIGACATQHESLQWFELQPLFGQRIAVTRASDQAESTVQLIHRLGGEAVMMPLLEVSEVEDNTAFESAMNRRYGFNWLAFTSSNGVRHFFSKLTQHGYDARDLFELKIAVVGSSTAEVLSEFSIKADLIAEQQNAEGLAESLLATNATGVLWVRGDRGRSTLADLLQASGSTCEELVVYESTDCEISLTTKAEIESGDIDWIPLASPAMARHVANFNILKETRIASISPLTTQAANESGLTVHAEATEYSWSGLIQAISDLVEATNSPSL